MGAGQEAEGDEGVMCKPRGMRWRSARMAWGAAREGSGAPGWALKLSNRSCVEFVVVWEAGARAVQGEATGSSPGAESSLVSTLLGLELEMQVRKGRDAHTARAWAWPLAFLTRSSSGSRLQAVASFDQHGQVNGKEDATLAGRLGRVAGEAGEGEVRGGWRRIQSLPRGPGNGRQARPRFRRLATRVTFLPSAARGRAGGRWREKDGGRKAKSAGKLRGWSGLC